jgi:hypothetical protein
MKYLIVLFKNKERKKIIKKFKTYDRAKNFYNKLINDSNNVLFSKEIENGKISKFEIGLVDSSPENFDLYFVKDELGRQIKVDINDSEFKILNINNYSIEETIFDLQKNKKIQTIDFIRKYVKRDGVKLISKLNNKVIVQNDNELFLFSLKSEEDCYRFLECLGNYMLKNNRLDVIIVPTDDITQKKYLYSLLDSKGISKSFLYRKSTTYFTGK